MADADNRRRGRAFREHVADALRLAGIGTAAARAARPRRASEALAADLPQADILGLPGGWHVRVHADVAMRWGSALDVAEQAARLAGHERAAVIGYRRERPVSDSFVVLTLGTFASILRRDAADWQSLAEFERWAREQVEHEE